MHYYFELRSYFYTREKNLSLTISINEIKNLWNVTLRNVQYRLKKLLELGYLNYTPGNGRGHSSEIVYFKRLQHDISDYVKTLMRSKSFDKIIELFSLPIPMDWIVSASDNARDIVKEYKNSGKDTLKYYTYFFHTIENLDPLLQWNGHEAMILSNIGDNLLVYDKLTQSIKPNIAHSWKPVMDCKKWIFYIRKGIKFHNNEELTAYDIAWSLNLFKKKRNSLTSFVDCIEDIKCISDYKVEIELNKANYWFDRCMASPNLIIFQENTGIDKRISVMSGAYKLVEKLEDRIILDANRSYFNGRALIDRIEVRKKDEQSKEDQYLTVNHKNNETIYKKILAPGVSMLCFNFRKDSIVHDKHFRSAIYNMVDFEKMKLYMGKDVIEDAGTFNTRNRKSYAKESKKIENLLQKSGYKGEKLNIYYFPTSVKEDATSNFNKFFNEKSKKYGINLEFKKAGFEDYKSYKIREDADLFFGVDIPNDDYWLSFIEIFQNINCLPSMFLTESQLSYINKTLDEIPNRPSKYDLDGKIEQVENYIRSENLVLFLFHSYKKLELDNQLNGFNNNSHNFQSIKNLWIDE